MAAKTTGKIHVAEVVRIRAPRDLQIRKDVAVIDRKNRLASLVDVLGTRCVKVGIVLLIKTNDSAVGNLAAASSLFRSWPSATSTPFFLMYGKVTAMSPRASALSIARSGSSKVCVGRLWQSTHCISNFGSALAESGEASGAGKVLTSPLSAFRYSTHGIVCLVRVRYGETDVNARTQVRTVNSRDLFPPTIIMRTVCVGCLLRRRRIC